MKAWEETWTVGLDEVLDGHGCVVVRAPHSGRDAHLALAAAAPDLYRALAAVEWSGETFRRGVDDDTRSCCPTCYALASSAKHEPDCILAAALRKARGE